MDADRFDGLARAIATGEGRRALLARTFSLLFGGVLLNVVGGSSRAVRAQTCAQDLPTAASIKAARNALANGAADVDLSPGGCIHYHREFIGTSPNAQVSKETTTYSGNVVTEWTHTYKPFRPSTPIPFPLPIYILIESVGKRDNDLDGFAEEQITIQRVLFLPPYTGPLRTQIITVEFDPATHAPTRQTTTSYDGSGGKHVKIEAGTGTMQVISEYDAAAYQEISIINGVATLAASTCSIGPVCVACPPGLEAEVMDALSNAGGTGGTCLYNLGLVGQALTVFRSSTRSFNISCAQGGTAWRAQIDTASAADPLRPIELGINIDWWTLVSERERVVFHELLHTAFSEDHAPLHGQMTDQERSKRLQQLDRVSACNSLCYNPLATRCECATCLGKKVCDPPCTTFADCASTTIAGFCPCNDETKFGWYPSFTECAVECPGSVKCFGIQCVPESNPCM